MAITSLADLVQALRQHRILEQSGLDECARMQAGFSEPRAFAGELIQRNLLTPYQVNLLFQGRGAELLFGSYVILERLGEGGMGTVFKARNWKMDRVVALKVIRKERVASATIVRRFQREVRAAAQLTHPNIVIAYDADAVGDRHYIAMEYIEGVDLGKLVQDAGPLPVAQACEYIRQAALGLQHAFENGVVHRDIKPTNLLLNRKTTISGTTALGATVKILDMGLALLHGGDDDNGAGNLTQDGAVVGTPDFLSPEQSRNSHTADIRSDLYSLGCTFYFLLTGRVPFPAETLSNKIWKHNFEEPIPLEQLRPDLPAGVVSVVRRLMSKKPAERFQTPAHLVAALEGPLNTPLPVGANGMPAGAPLAILLDAASRAAQPGSGVPHAIFVGNGQTAPLARHAPSWMSITQPLSALPIASLFPASWSRRRRSAVLAVTGAAFTVLLVAATLLIFSNRKDQTYTPALSASALVPEPGRLKGVRAWTIETHSQRGGRTVQLFSPDNRWYAVATDLGTVRIWDASNGELQRILVDPAGRIDSMVFAPNSQLLATGTPDKKIRLWDVATGKLRQTLDASVPVSFLSWAPDGRVLVANAAEGRLAFFDPEAGNLLYASSVPCGAFNSWAWSPLGNQLATSNADRNVRIWDAASGQLLRALPAIDRIYCLAWSQEGAKLAAGGERAIHIWDAATGKELAPFEGRTGPAHCLAWAPDGVRLAAGGRDEIRIWDINAGRLLSTRDRLGAAPAALIWSNTGSPTARESPVLVFEATPGRFLRVLLVRNFSLQWSADGERVATLGSFTTGLIDAASGKTLAQLTDHPNVWNVLAAWSPNSKLLVTNTPYDTSLRVWDIASGQMLRTISGHRGNPTALAWSPDGTRLASAANDLVVRLWDPSSGKLLDSFSGHKERVNSLAWSPDNRRLAFGGADKTIPVWDVASGTPQTQLAGFTGTIAQLKWSPDGTLLAARGDEIPIRGWRLDATTPAFTLEGHKAAVTSFAWSPDSKKLATGSLDGTARIWDAASADSLVLEGHSGFVYSVAYAPGGARLATGSSDRTVRLWDTASGRLLDNLQGHPDTIYSLAWLPDRTTLLAYTPRQVHRWNTTTGQSWRSIDGPGSFFPAPDGKILAGAFGYGLRFWNLDTAQVFGTLLYLHDDRILSISARGHYRSIPRNLTELVYVVQTDAGQETLSPAEFAQRFGWKNDPSKVQLRGK